MQQKELQIKEAEVQRKTQKDQADIQLKQGDLQRKAMKDMADVKIDEAQLQLDEKELQLDAQKEGATLAANRRKDNTKLDLDILKTMQDKKKDK